MKYTTLKEDIINILHSSDFNLDLKFYDENGNTTIDVDDAYWGYIHNENMIIEFMTDENPTIIIWKDKTNINNKIKNILQRIRELAVLNGVSVQIRVYNNLDRRKIYNLIRSNIILSKEDSKMNESNNEIEEAFKSIIYASKNTKKSSDFYLSESLQSQNAESILKEIISEVSHLKNLKNVNLDECFSKLLTSSSSEDVHQLYESLSDKIKSKLSESTKDIKNIVNFVKQEYLNNVPFTSSKPNTLFVLENVKVYKSNIKNKNDDLIRAYNHLISLNENATSDLQLLKIIKNNKILETYNVSKKALLNLWLTKNSQPIKQKSAYIIENYLGEKIAFSTNLSQGIHAIAQYINNGGDKDSSICKNIVNETIKFNHIASFIVEYKNNYNVRKYIPKFKKIFNEVVNKFKIADSNFSNKLFESQELNINYDSQLDLLTKEIGISHPALKYLAIEEAYNDYLKSKVLMETKNQDANILVDELKHYTPISSVISTYIIENKLNQHIDIENVNQNNIVKVASQLYESLTPNLNKITTPISSALFNIIHSNKQIVNTKINFMNTLIKYCK